MRKIFLILFIFIFFAGISHSQVPRVINYQGMLHGSDDMPVPEGEYKITFNLYDEPGNLLWSETHDPVFIGGGMFHVMLGTLNPFNIPFDEPYYLGIQIDNDPELDPRMMLTSAAYAIRAEDADKVLGYGLNPTPQPETILPLDHNGKFPASVLPAAQTGNYLRKNEPDTSKGSYSESMLRVVNNGSGSAIFGQSSNESGVTGRSDNNNGITGWTGAAGKSGVFAHSTNGKGITGRSDNDDGVVGWTNKNDKSGVFGHSESGIGVTGQSQNNAGVLAKSTNGHGISVPLAGINGIDIVNAHKNGVKVYDATESAVYVQTAGHDGLRVTRANWSGVYIESSGGDGVRIQSAGNDGIRVFEGVGRDYFRAGSEADPDFIFNKGGDAYADSGWFSGADFAELIEVENNNVNNFEPGDVLVISTEKDRAVTLSSEPYSSAIIGVYSTKPGFIGTTHPMQGKNENEIPVAITGIVPCKVSAENGSIVRGDLLTTSGTPGYAMKATEPKIGTILGKALENLETGQGKIEALIILH